MQASSLQEVDELPPVLVSRLRSRSGLVNAVNVLDLSLAGCMIERQAMSIRQDDRVLLRLPGLRYLAAAVAWTEDGRAGLVFEEPLYEPVLNHVVKSFIRRRAA